MLKMDLEKCRKKLKVAIPLTSPKQATSKRLKQLHLHFSNDNRQYCSSILRTASSSFRFSSAVTKENDMKSYSFDDMQISSITKEERSFRSTTNGSSLNRERSPTPESHNKNFSNLMHEDEGVHRSSEEGMKRYFEDYIKKVILDSDDIPKEIKQLLLNNISEGYYHITYSFHPLENKRIENDNGPSPFNYYQRTNKTFYSIHEFSSINTRFDLKATTILDNDLSDGDRF